MQKETVEVENVLRNAFSGEVKSSINVARYERKKLQSSSKSQVHTPSHDRFIPLRTACDIDNVDVLNFNSCTMSDHGNVGTPFSKGSLVDMPPKLATPGTASKANRQPSPSPAKAGFQRALAETMGANSSRILTFKEKPPAPSDDHQNPLRVVYTQNVGQKAGKFLEQDQKKKMRNLPNNPDRVLDAPDIIDDYYLNLLDWGTNGLLAVGLGPTVYLWNPTSGATTELCSLKGDDYVTSVKFNSGGEYLSVGTSNTTTMLWDVVSERQRQLRTLKGHSARVSSLDWNQHLLCTGGRDSIIVAHDVRIAQPMVATYCNGHSQEVCGLKWNSDGTTLASGGNDNNLAIWDARSTGTSNQNQPRTVLTEHQAAVKALAWSPHQRNLLASGGGTNDRSIKFWNTSSATPFISSVDAGSQVCSLLWNPSEKELLSSHGFSENQLTLWKYPSMQKIKELKGHTARVLHMAASPDGVTVCSAGADETLRFWKVLGSNMLEKTAGGKASLKTYSTADSKLDSDCGQNAVVAPGNRHGLSIR